GVVDASWVEASPVGDGGVGPGPAPGWSGGSAANCGVTWSVLSSQVGLRYNGGTVQPARRPSAGAVPGRRGACLGGRGPPAAFVRNQGSVGVIGRFLFPTPGPFLSNSSASFRKRRRSSSVRWFLSIHSMARSYHL